MFNPVRNIIARAIRRDYQPINVLTGVTHSPFECNLAKCNVELYGMVEKNFLPWNPCRNIPKNYHVLSANAGDDALPKDVDFHAVLSQNPDVHYPILSRYAQMFGIPLISLYHTTPPTWNRGWQQYVQWAKQTYKSDYNVFITEYSRDLWGYTESEGIVIHHAADTENFYPLNLNREGYVQYTCNMLRERDYACGWRLWETIKQGVDAPFRLIGKDPDPSYATQIESPKELNISLNKCGVYLNCSLQSPFPMSLLEALVAGTPIISTSTCEIPLALEHKKNCLLFPPEKPELGAKYVQQVLTDRELATKLGMSGREAALEFFSPNKFISKWQDIFNLASTNERNYN